MTLKANILKDNSGCFPICRVTQAVLPGPRVCVGLVSPRWSQYLHPSTINSHCAVCLKKTFHLCHSPNIPPPHPLQD